MNRIEDYANTISSKLKDLYIPDSEGVIIEHLLEEFDEFKEAKDANSSADELADIIILSYRLIQRMGFSPEEILRKKFEKVSARLDLTKKIVGYYRSQKAMITGKDAYSMAKYILEENTSPESENPSLSGSLNNCN